MELEDWMRRSRKERAPGVGAEKLLDDLLEPRGGSRPEMTSSLVDTLEPGSRSELRRVDTLSI